MSTHDAARSSATHVLQHNIAGDVVGTTALNDVVGVRPTTVCNKHGYASRGDTTTCPYCKQVSESCAPAGARARPDHPHDRLKRRAQAVLDVIEQYEQEG